MNGLSDVGYDFEEVTIDESFGANGEAEDDYPVCCVFILSEGGEACREYSFCWSWEVGNRGRIVCGRKDLALILPQA